MPSRKSKQKKQPIRKSALKKPAKAKATQASSKTVPRRMPAKKVAQRKRVQENLQQTLAGVQSESQVPTTIADPIQTTPPTTPAPTTAAIPALRILTRAKISDHLQGSEDWHRDRLGKLTASRMHRVINGTNKGWGTLMAELYREINSPEQVLSEEPVYAEDMEHGKDFEDAARASAELELGVEIVTVGFATHYLRTWLGASVDGLILKSDSNGMLEEARRILGKPISVVDREWLFSTFMGYVDATVEIKCFTNIQNHAYVWTNRRVLDKYVPQVQTQNMVFESPRSIFVSYHEEMPDPHARTAIVEVAPDLQYQQALISRAESFNADFEMYKANGGILPILAPTIPRRF